MTPTFSSSQLVLPDRDEHRRRRMGHDVVENGMSTAEVAARLGRPSRRALVRREEASVDQELWVYPDREVLFDEAGRALGVLRRRPRTRWVIADGVATAYHLR